MLALGLLSWPAFARIVRARVITVDAEPYVEAARALGGTPLHIARHHVFPATLELLPAKLILTVRFALFAEATLAFLGLGDPSARSWGTMLGWAFSDPLTFAGGSWTWWVLPPALAIVAAVLGTTLLATSFESPPTPSAQSAARVSPSAERRSAAPWRAATRRVESLFAK
jgi:peptide/nickel transport system permease protein